MKEVKYCLICGKEAEFDEIYYDKPMYYWIHDCLLGVKIGSCNELNSKEEAIADWNNYVSRLEDFQHESFLRGYRSL